MNNGMSNILLVPFLIICIHIAHVVMQSSSHTALTGDSKKSISSFQTLLKRNRAEQIAAVKKLLKLKYEQQYKMLTLMFNKMFEVLLSSKILLEDSDYIPGDVLPTNDTTKDGLYQLLDSTTLYCELQLKLPDITDRIMKKHQDYLVLIKWAIGFTNVTGLYDHKSGELIDLAAQEMNVIERLPSYTNPYRLPAHSKNHYKRGTDGKRDTKGKKFSKGSRITRPRHTEL